MTTLDETRLVGFMEAVFSLELDDQHWLSEVLSALGALCGSAPHYRGFFYDTTHAQHVKIWNVCAPRTSPELDATFARWSSSAELDLFRGADIGRVAREQQAQLSTELEQHGIGELFRINGRDPAGTGCMLLIGCNERDFSPSASELELYQRLAANLSRAFRARRRLSALIAETANDSGVENKALDDSASIVGVAREQLRSSPPLIEAAGAKSKRAGSSSALEFSHPASRARLTLVHTFEERGRRYIVARENDVRPLGLAALTAREREIVEQATSGFSNKQIAYNLGISNATVRVLMARAANRIGVRTRRELLAHPAVEELKRTATPELARAVAH